MNNLLYCTKRFFSRNGSTILSGVGTVGVIATTVLAVKATPKALTLLEKAKEEKSENLSKLEVVQTVGPTYIPTIVMGASTIACVIGASMLSKHQQAALISAYALVDNSYKEYKKKLKELYGEETHQNIVDSIVAEKAKDISIHSECLCASCDLSVEDNDSEPRLFYDEYSNRYFEATIEQVISAEYHLNRNYILRGYTVLNELYEFLGLEPTKQGSILGWAPLDDGMYWIDFNHRKVVMDDGLECYILEMPFGPEIDYDEY